MPVMTMKKNMFAVPQEPEKRVTPFQGGTAFQTPEVAAQNEFLDIDTKQAPLMGAALLANNRSFFDDYAERFYREHPEYGRDLDDYKSRQSNLYEDTEVRAQSMDSAKKKGGEWGHYNPSTDNIGMTERPEAGKLPEDHDFTHEMAHRMRTQILGGGNQGTADERTKVYNAYDFIKSPEKADNPEEQIEYDIIERLATNTELRRQISKDNGNVTGEALDDVIRGLSDEELIKYLKTLNGYTKPNMFGVGGVNRSLKGGKFRNPEQGMWIKKALIEVADAGRAKDKLKNAV